MIFYVLYKSTWNQGYKTMSYIYTYLETVTLLFDTFVGSPLYSYILHNIMLSAARLSQKPLFIS